MANQIKNKVVIAGGSGFIGQYLTQKLASSGYEVVILSRSPHSYNGIFPARTVFWDGASLGEWAKEIENALAIINLAGESIAGEKLPTILFGRWTPKKKDAIIRSRVLSGKVLTEAVENANNKPDVFIQASGIGFYGTEGTQILEEDDPPGSDFLAGVSQEWERSSLGVEALGVRRAVIRSGVVLGAHGGILPLIALPIRLFLGGRLGSGKQPFPWIHIVDEVDAIQFLMENPACRGAYNFVAPEIKTSAQFSQILAGVLHRPFYLPVPAFILRLLLGEKSVLVLKGQNAAPRNLLDAGFHFRFTEAEAAIKAIYKRG
jgi:uncharacterized protein